MSERNYLIATSAFPLFGPARLNLLLKYFKSAKRIWFAKPSVLIETGLSPQLVSSFVKFRSGFDVESYLKKLNQWEANVVTITDKTYPKNLKGIPNSPPVLYFRGDILKKDDKAIAIVGTRSMSPYGGQVVTRMVSELTKYGVTIISGLAFGVDVAAHKTALLNGGRTIAVLASGIDIISPVTNRPLALEFIKKNGAVVCEYPLGHVPNRSDFAIRNRLISGLALGVVVIEGGMKSGTFYTVKAAADQGRPVFAVPGPITQETSAAPNYLIQNGAKPVTDVRDILEELDI